MLFFRNDYAQSACAPVMEALCAATDSYIGYGEDEHSTRAKQMIRALCDCPQADVELFIGGTNVNAVTIAALLRPWEGVISPVSGHINGHESGAVESYGHKILALETDNDGKLHPDMLDAVVAKHADPHLVKPRMVYISNATEYGAIYSRTELAALSQRCKQLDLLLFLDGARLGVALASPGNDVRFPDLARYCDVFTIGGTKNGAMMGEALVVPAGQAELFRFKKQRGGVLAKGFLLGVQFEALLADNAQVYLENAKTANDCAQELQRGLQDLSVPLLFPSPTNQIFPILETRVVDALEKHISFERWEQIDKTHCAIRFVCSFASRMEDVAALLLELAELL